MGIFGKIFKGIGKVFKGIGKWLKKKWQKFGKFMNKLGIVGQIGMMLVTSGMMNAAMSGMSFIGKAAMTGSTGFHRGWHEWLLRDVRF